MRTCRPSRSRAARICVSGSMFEPTATNADLMPDTSTPVVHAGLVFGSCEQLVCLDLNDGLKLLWKVDDEPFDAYSSFIAGNGRVLAATQTGKLCLLDATRRPYL